ALGQTPAYWPSTLETWRRLLLRGSRRARDHRRPRGFLPRGRDHDLSHRSRLGSASAESLETSALEYGELSGAYSDQEQRGAATQVRQYMSFEDRMSDSGTSRKDHLRVRGPLTVPQRTPASPPQGVFMSSRPNFDNHGANAACRRAIARRVVLSPGRRARAPPATREPSGVVLGGIGC